jgi:hypothetical protein
MKHFIIGSRLFINGFFDHHRQGVSFKQDAIKFVLVKI